MNKKLLAVAVAGALAAPGLALAQSSVTISGVFKMSLESMRIGSPVTTAAAAAAAGPAVTTARFTAAAGAFNTTENRLGDESSRILFNVVEDLGGGLAALGQLDMRFNPATGALAASGNDHVGVRSKTMGRVIFGRQDLHYGNRESNLTDLAGSLRADSISLIAYMRDGTTAIASASRTPNVVHYLSPNWGGFTVIGAYSFNPLAAVHADLTTNIRKGSGWHVNPNFERSNWQVGYSYWNAKQDAGGATLAAGDQLSNRLYGSFKVAGFKLGLAWDKSRVKAAIGGTLAGVTGDTGVVGAAFSAGKTIGDRTVWTFPASYTMGNNQFHFHYTKARDDRATSGAGFQDGAKMVALSYQYTLSKRTSVGLNYAKITNDDGAAYNLFTGQTSSLGNSLASSVNRGEDPRVFSGTIRHSF